MLSNWSHDHIKHPEWPLYDPELVFHSLRKKSKFRNMKMQFLQDLLSGRGHYDYLKCYALDQLQHTFLMKCNIFLHLGNCEGIEKESNDIELSSGIFKWGYQDFVQRRQLGNLLYVDVLSMKSDSCLNIYKFKTDIYELLNLILPVFDAAFAGIFCENFDMQSLEEPIEDALKLIETIDTIEDELDKNQKKFMLSFNRNFIMSSTKRDSTQKMLMIQLETRLMNNHIWDPIEIRYQLNWYSTKVNQAQYKCDKMVDGYLKQIENYKYRGNYDTKCSHNCMDYLYMSINNLKSLLNDFQKKYDNDYEKIENRVTYQRIQIDKLKEQKRFLTEAIQRFHEEIEHMRQFEERLNSRREDQKLKELELSKKKSKRNLSFSKSGGKGKGKNKK